METKSELLISNERHLARDVEERVCVWWMHLSGWDDGLVRERVND